MRLPALWFVLGVSIAPLPSLAATLNVAGVTAGENVSCCNPFGPSLVEVSNAIGAATNSRSFYDQALDATTESGFLFRRGANAEASALPGVLRANVDASYFLGRPDLRIPVTVGAVAVASFSDTLRVAGPGFGLKPVTFQLSASGGRSGASTAQAFLSVNSDRAIVEFLDTFPNGPQYFCKTGFSCLDNQVTIMLPANTNFTLAGTLGVVASARGDPINLNSTATYGNTGRFFVTVDDPQYRLISESGFDYSPTPVPEPGSLWLLAVGLIGLAARFGVAGRGSQRFTTRAAA
jgi:hypothetical protein